MVTSAGAVTVADMSIDNATSNEYDVVIVGGGAAGLSAALVLSRARRTVAVVDAGEPRNAPAAHMQGFLSRDGMSPMELLRVGRQEIESYGAHVLDGTVDHVSPREVGGFEVSLADGRQLEGRRILVATGLRDELPDVPGLRERFGRDLLHCPYCHGYEVRDQKLGVLGGTPGAVQHALLLRQWAADVVYFPHTDTLSDEDRELLVARAVGIVEGPVAGLVVADDRLQGVRLADGAVIERAAVFVRPRFHPNNRLLAELGCEVDDQGWVRSDATGRTSAPGVWVAGNAVNPRAQVITAAGEGSAAAIALNADLVDEEVARDLEGFRGAPRERPALPPPTKHQLALMIWVAVFPTLALLNLSLNGVLEDLATVPRTFLLATIAVPVVIYGVMPRLHRVRARLLRRAA